MKMSRLLLTVHLMAAAWRWQFSCPCKMHSCASVPQDLEMFMCKEMVQKYQYVHWVIFYYFVFPWRIPWGKAVSRPGWLFPIQSLWVIAWWPIMCTCSLHALPLECPWTVVSQAARSCSRAFPCLNVQGTYVSDWSLGTVSNRPAEQSHPNF